MRCKRREMILLSGFLIVYFCLNLLFLTRYPLVHSDESWLSGLTRNMMAMGDVGVTEPFFDLKPRYPHAIKILFHLMQMPMIAVFGYTVFAIRLLSLLWGMAALVLVYRCCRTVASFWLSFAIMGFVAFNGQFIETAHTARQEIILLCALLGLLLLLLQSKGQVTNRLTVKLGVLTGLSVGLHPNSFLLAMGCGLALLMLMLGNHTLRMKPLLRYAGLTCAIALVFVGISFLFDAQFPAHYHRYGESEFALDVPVADKVMAVGAYLQKLWLGVSGTYTLPPLAPTLTLAGIATVAGLRQAVTRKSPATIAILSLSLGALLGTVLIGRYNQLSAVLWMLPTLLLLAPLLVGIRFAPVLAATLALTMAVFAYTPIQTAISYPYDAYLAQLAAYVTPQTKTLANLNAGFAFDNGALLDVRNLTYLKENGLTFADYVQSREIKVIVWTDEMDYLYDHRPEFNTLYGNPRYVPEVKAFLRDHCKLVGSFENSGYGTRIVQLIGTQQRVWVYQVNLGVTENVQP